MPIDWFTVIAQAINFLILVWLLQRFLYKPILKAVDERENGIAAQLAAAEAKTAEAQKERDDFQHKNETFDQERAALFAGAKVEAEAERQRLLNEARTEANALRAKLQDAWRTEQRDLSQEIASRTQREVFAVTRKTLADLATASLEEQMGGVFVQRLRAMSGEAKEQLAAALNTQGRPALVRSAFDLPQAQRVAIDLAIKDTFATEAHVAFETAPELVGGIELSAGGRKVAWSIADYLATLERNAGELLHPGVQPGPESEPVDGPRPATPVAKGDP